MDTDCSIEAIHGSEIIGEIVLKKDPHFAQKISRSIVVKKNYRAIVAKEKT